MTEQHEIDTDLTREEALAYSIVSHAHQFLFAVITGLIVLWKSGVTLRNLRDPGTSDAAEATEAYRHDSESATDK